MTTTVVHGGRILDQTGERRADLVVDATSGTVLDIDPEPGAPTDSGLDGDRRLDATSCYVCPGFVDLNAHLGQPGREEAETIESGSRAAAVGGYTAVVAMPDTDPRVESAAVVNEIIALAKSASCEVVLAGSLTIEGEGRVLAPFAELADLGVRFFTEGEHSLQDGSVMRRALEYVGGVAAGTGCRLVVANPARLDGLADGGVMNEGEQSALMGVPGEPAVAEELMVGRDIALARLTGTPMHLQQISTAASVALVRAAKADGVAVTAEVSPHHLVLDEAVCSGYDANTRVRPPLRTSADVVAVRDGLLDGTIDAIATGHRPWPPDAKERPFDAAPAGIVGLETAMAVVLTELGLPLDRLLPALSWRPAEIAGVAGRHGGPIEVGRPANLTVVDPHEVWTVDPERFVGRSSNTAFAGRTLTGRVRHTISAGRPVLIDGIIVDHTSTDHSGTGRTEAHGAASDETAPTTEDS